MASAAPDGRSRAHVVTSIDEIQYNNATSLDETTTLSAGAVASGAVELRRGRTSSRSALTSPWLLTTSAMTHQNTPVAATAEGKSHMALLEDDLLDDDFGEEEDADDEADRLLEEMKKLRADVENAVNGVEGRTESADIVSDEMHDRFDSERAGHYQRCCFRQAATGGRARACLHKCPCLRQRS